MAEVYDTTRFGELYYASQSPSVLNLGLAARYISAVLTHYQIPFAMIGGWAVFLRGSGRQTQDVDVAVTTTMDYLKQVLLLQSRICFPVVHGQTCVQVFIRTGHSFDVDYPQTPDVAISMDLVISGNLGTPQNLGNSCEQIVPSVDTPQGSPAVVLGLFSQLTSKLIAFTDRGEQTVNDFQDLLFLLGRYGYQIAAFRDYLNLSHRHALVQRIEATFAEDQDFVNYSRQVFGV